MSKEKASNWLPLIDYSAMTGISLSTLRRHIKSNKIKYRFENGKYLLDAGSITYKHQISTDDKIFLEEKIKSLSKKLSKANKEILELKMLVSMYEQKK